MCSIIINSIIIINTFHVATNKRGGPLCVAVTEGGCDMWLVVSADRLLNGIIRAPEELEIVLRQQVLSIFNLETE